MDMNFCGGLKFLYIGVRAHKIVKLSYFNFKNKLQFKMRFKYITFTIKNIYLSHSIKYHHINFKKNCILYMHWMYYEF